ncbi:HK97 gp10 family phage protein [Bacillus sp. FJAT-22090]|uniref:HK97 gp10 family phage protein n=1 Tax=Bacillus sp. FJAT-22090 TaxID=1581038 RepID=UPI0011A92E5D|nr:HK97 gp10 family phage protein [Bacillus sp. FJAT-22090]
MARWGRADFQQLKRMQKKMEKLQNGDYEKFCEQAAKELAARLLAKVIRRTPVGIYDQPVNFTTKDGDVVSFTPNTGMMGGTLRRGWTAKTEGEALSGGNTNATAYAESLIVRKTGSTYEIEIINPVNYASYVEFGHRTANHAGWVKGRFMLTISENELDAQAPKILEKKLMKFLGGVFGGD